MNRAREIGRRGEARVSPWGQMDDGYVWHTMGRVSVARRPMQDRPAALNTTGKGRTWQNASQFSG